MHFHKRPGIGPRRAQDRDRRVRRTVSKCGRWPRPSRARSTTGHGRPRLAWNNSRALNVNQINKPNDLGTTQPRRADDPPKRVMMKRRFVGRCTAYIRPIAAGLPAGGWIRRTGRTRLAPGSALKGRSDASIPPGGGSTAHSEHAQCAHSHHVGTCPACQRAAQRRSEAQLAAAVAAREAWATRGLPRPVLTGTPEDNQFAIPPLGCQPRAYQRAPIGL
jgi:hypothetical protein